MHTMLPFTFFLFCCIPAFAQTHYTGSIGDLPIELQADTDKGEHRNGVYLYKSRNTPIRLDCNLKDNTWTLFEMDNRGNPAASLRFPAFNADSSRITGIWKNLSTGKELPIILQKDQEIETGENISWTGKEVIQVNALKEHYFRTVLSKSKEEYYPRVTSIKILHKKTDRLIQELKTNCEFRGINSIDTGDFNFDGMKDFSIYQESYAGANYSNLYYLYDPLKKEFRESNIAGISLSFDAATKTVTETNQCCGGTAYSITTYKIVKNEMVKLSHREYEWSEKEQDFIEKKGPVKKKKK